MTNPQFNWRSLRLQPGGLRERHLGGGWASAAESRGRRSRVRPSAGAAVLKANKERSHGSKKIPTPRLSPIVPINYASKNEARSISRGPPDLRRH